MNAVRLYNISSATFIENTSKPIQKIFFNSSWNVVHFIFHVAVLACFFSDGLLSSINPWRRMFCVGRPYLVALRYSLDADTAWQPVSVELVSTGLNDAANMSRYSDDDSTLFAACETSDVVRLQLPELLPGFMFYQDSTDLPLWLMVHRQRLFEQKYVTVVRTVKFCHRIQETEVCRLLVS